VSNDRGKSVKVKCNQWLSHDLLSRLSNSSTSIARLYQALFPEVRSFEAFKQLHLGLISDKTLPAIAQVAGSDNAQSLSHFAILFPGHFNY
jgi:SRSO17 transposase